MGVALTATARALFVAGAIVGASPSGEAQTPAPDAARKGAEADESLRTKAKQLEASRAKSAAESERISKVLVEFGKQIERTEGELRRLESKLEELAAEENEMRTSLERRHRTISALLAVLQRMGRNPPPVMVTRREDALTMVRSAMLMGSAFPKLGEEAQNLANTLKKLGEVIQSTRADQERRKSELAEYNKQRGRVMDLHAEKRQSEKAFQAELDSLREAIAKTARTELAKSERAKSEDPSGLLAGIDKEVKAAAVLAPSGDRVAMLAPGRIKPLVPFAQTKGSLQLPSQGRRIVAFGGRTRHGRKSEGIQIQTRHGGTVFSPCEGLVVYAAEFRTYGQVLIINAGDGYHILLAGLSQIDVQVGQSVLMGEPVGVMSSGVKSPGAEEGGPVLTVEFRKDQRPVDPDPWWSDTSRKG